MITPITLLSDIKRSGLTKADATKLGFKVLPKVQTNTLVSKRLEAYKIPYYSIKGKETEFFRVRFLEEEQPKFNAINNKVIRYSQPEDTLPRLYFPFAKDGRWKVLAKDVEQPLFITEGEKKAAKATKEGLPTIGLGGVWAWKSKKKNLDLLPEFFDINWKHRSVYLVFDNDLRFNYNVLGALNAFSKKLTDLGAVVHIIFLPYDGSTKMGLDDYLVEYSADDLLQETTQPFELSHALWDMNDKVAFIESPPSFYILKTRDVTTKAVLVDTVFPFLKHKEQSINSKGDVSTKEVKSASRWVDWEHRRTHSKLEYAPGHPVTLPNGALNIWEGWGVEPKKGDTKPFYKLLELIMGDSPEFMNWFIKWLAYPIQNPGVKMYSSVLLYGWAKGTGKTFIGHIMGDIYGSNYTEISDEELHDDYNDWAEGKQFILGEEVSGSDKRRENDRIKHMITRETIAVRKKYVPRYTLRDCTNYLFTSQHPDAFFIESGDRRLAVHEVINKEDRTFYDKIDTWRKKDGGPSHLFYNLLHEVDLQDFNPRDEAPHTASKADMEVLSRSDLDNFAHDLRDDPVSVLSVNGVKTDKEIFVLDELIQVYDPEGKKGTHNKAMGNSLRRAGFRMHSVLTKHGTKRLWPIVDRETWWTKTPATWAAAYDRTLASLARARSRLAKN